jgi:hypothetical protein
MAGMTSRALCPPQAWLIAGYRCRRSGRRQCVNTNMIAQLGLEYLPAGSQRNLRDESHIVGSAPLRRLPA